MSVSSLPARLSPNAAFIALLAAGSLASGATSAAASPAHSVAPTLKATAHARAHADHTLVVQAKRLKVCLHAHPRHCTTQRRAVQHAGTELVRANHRVAKLSHSDRAIRASAAAVSAPKLTVSGRTLTWNAIGSAKSYLLVTKVPHQADQYSTVNATSVTPPAVPGAAVKYSVRTTASGSAWASEVSIAYSAAPSPADTQAAPVLHASGQILAWNSVGGSSTYVLVAKVPGQADHYTTVSGTSATPSAVPGSTVTYGIRSAVDGSVWATEVSIAYPASNPTPPPAPSSTSVGVVAGSALTYELGFISKLGAHTARMEFDVNTPVSQMTSTIDAYAKAGVRPLLLATFYGRTPTAAEAKNLATWADAFGPGGSFWAGKSYPANTAVTAIEFGNETSYSYQFSDNSMSTYAARAQTYALRAKDAQVAIDAANPSVGLLVIGDNAVNQTAWVTNMFKAVPDLGQRAAGWTIHPYGPTWQTRIDSTVNSTKAAGSPDLPIWVTEWGLSSDNGRCLSDNYGYDKCMTYGEAASTLHTALTGMKSRYGSRLGAFYMYQAHDQQATGTKTGREAYFGATQSNGASKSSFTTEVKADLTAK